MKKKKKPSVQEIQWRAVFSPKLEHYPHSPDVYPYNWWKHKLTSPPADEIDIVFISLIVLYLCCWLFFTYLCFR